MSRFSPNLEFTVSHLGSVQDGSFTHKPLTLFCGPNNRGKTWVLYSLYHFYERLHSVLHQRGETSKKPDLRKFNKQVSHTLDDFFNTESRQIRQAIFHLKSVRDWRLLVNSPGPANIFLMPAERNGLHLFFRELSTRRTALLHHASRENIDINELLRDVIRSRYAVPIAHYIDWLNELTETQKRRSEKFHPHAERLKKDLAGGAYKIDPRSGTIVFKPYQHRRDGRKTEELGLHMSSSTVKSLFGLWFYLEHQASPGAMLMIDEPELNIHPDNQRKIARLLAQLVNAGLNVTISTHSDYIVREYNSLLMLSQDKSRKLRGKYNYRDDEILKPEQVGAYLFDNQTIKPFDITPDDGIYATTFDEVIENPNKVNNDIFYTLKERKDEQLSLIHI